MFGNQSWCAEAELVKEGVREPPREMLCTGGLVMWPAVLVGATFVCGHIACM